MVKLTAIDACAEQQLKHNFPKKIEWIGNVINREERVIN